MASKYGNKQMVQNNTYKSKQSNTEHNSTSESNNIRDTLNAANLVVNSIKSELMHKTNSNLNGVYETFGYKLELVWDDFYRAYKRQDIAGRIIDAIVDFTWKDFPLIVDDDEAQNIVTKSGTNLKQLKKIIQNKKSLALRRKRTMALNNFNTMEAARYNDELAMIESVEVSYTAFEEEVWRLLGRFPMLKIMKRADTLNCIGRYSILVIGTQVRQEGSEDRINDLKEELPKGTATDEISFIMPYAENQITIQTWETNQQSPRYGLPKTYSIQVSGDSGSSINYQVHWSRVIHIAEDLLDSDVYGTPKLERVFNDLQDMLKVVGGSAEMFWLGAYQGLVFNVQDGYTLDDASRNAMTQEIENYVNKLQRFIKTKGVDVTTISSPAADPRGNFEVLVKLISGSSNVPIRILLGAENGVYAGDTDQDTWHTYISSRRNSHADEAMIRPLIDRLIEYGYIPRPLGGEYYIKWPELYLQTQVEKLTNAKLLVDTAKAATPFGNTFDIITVEEVRTAIGLDPTIPNTQYEQFAIEGDALMDEFEELPPSDDTEDTSYATALEIFRARQEMKNKRMLYNEGGE